MTGLKMAVNNIISPVDTPAFVYDEAAILKAIKNARILLGESCKLLFPLKSFTIIDALYLIAPLIDGFSASSLFEAQYARDILEDHKTIHFTTPGVKPDEIEIISGLLPFETIKIVLAFFSLKYLTSSGK